MGKKKVKVKYLPGFVFDDKGEQIVDQKEAWKKDAECGCGINCCLKALVLEDHTSGAVSYLYIEGGVVKVTTDPTILA